MTEFRKGDKVRVAFEAEVTNVHEDGRRLWVYHAGVCDTYLDVSDVELIERADDPSKDPVGTVRRSKDGKIAVRVREGGEQSWIRLEIGENTWGWLFDDWVRGWEIVNTTIVERPLWTGDSTAAKQSVADDPKRELWVGDGSEEPPAYVTKVRDKDGTHLVRSDSGWAGVESDEAPWSTAPKSWGERWEDEYGPFTEVRP